MLLALLALPTTALGAPCQAWDAPKVVATVDAASVTESSGIARSRTRPGVWFTHDDSGGKPTVYAFDLQGNYLGQHSVPGAGAIDWEDMAAGPCPDGDGACLYLADIGDNDRKRPHVTLYVAREPASGQPAPLVATWTLTYPDGPHNAETLLVHPVSGQVSIVTKSADGASQVFRVTPPKGSGSAAVEQIATWQLSGPTKAHRLATAGDWNDDGTQLVVRTYLFAWGWTADPAQPDAVWAREPTRIPLAVEQQGEAIGFSAAGDLVTTSEGSPMPIAQSTCRATP